MTLDELVKWSLNRAKEKSRMATAEQEAKAAKEKMIKVHVANIERHGDKLILPMALEPVDAIDVLKAFIDSEEKTTKFSEVIDCFIWDGAIALWKAAVELFGIATPVPTPGFWKDDPPALITVQTGPDGRTTTVPWGRFTLPGVAGFVETSFVKDQQTGRFMFQASAEVKRKHERQMRALFALTKEIAFTQSIYRGKPIKMRFNDEDGDPIKMPEPRFIDLTGTMENKLVLNKDTQAIVETALFTPLMHTKRCIDAGIPVKRGIMLAGPYGTGKTLLAYIAAKKAVENGWTFCYCERADELASMVYFAHQYQPALVFCEDIDRVMSGDRSISIDQLLNIIDGIESKTSKIMVVLTTNDVGSVNRAMLRPGRLDAVIEIGNPDADAVQRLIRVYAGQYLAGPDSDLEDVGQFLAGQSPAVIRECVERSKLSAIKLSTNGHLEITGAALYDAALGMRFQLELLNENPPVPSTGDRLAEQLGILIAETTKPVIGDSLAALERKAGLR